MRILFTTTPTFSHTTPMIPLAQAARLAGHQVLFAGGGVTLKTAAGAGIPVLDAARGQDLGAPHRRFVADPANHRLPQEQAVRAFIGVMSEIGQMLLPALVDTAREWEADIVVTPAWMPWGMVAARAAGALAVLHGIGLRYPAVPYMADRPPAFVRELGVTEFPHADAEVSLSPASLEQYSPTAPGEVPFPVLSMRPCTYNGSGEVPAWILGKSERPRIAVTMGTATAGHGWPEVLRSVVEGTAELDADVVLAAGGVDLAAMAGPLPERVRVVDFVPLSALLPRCDALVHHAGMNSMFTSIAARVPQVALPADGGGDPKINAMVLARRGAGIAVPRERTSAEEVGKALREVLSTPSYRAATEEVADEMAAMPAPHEVVGQLVGLAAAR